MGQWVKRDLGVGLDDVLCLVKKLKSQFGPLSSRNLGWCFRSPNEEVGQADAALELLG